MSRGSIAAFFVAGPPNCASACHAPAICSHTRCPRGAMVSLCRAAKDAAEAIEGGVPIPAERQHQGRLLAGVGWGWGGRWV